MYFDFNLVKILVMNKTMVCCSVRGNLKPFDFNLVKILVMNKIVVCCSVRGNLKPYLTVRQQEKMEDELHWPRPKRNSPTLTINSKNFYTSILLTIEY